MKGICMGRARLNAPHYSDLDKYQFVMEGKYFKKYGKKAGNRLHRRTGKLNAICRSPKHLP